jgi:hypothetical protein
MQIDQKYFLRTGDSPEEALVTVVFYHRHWLWWYFNFY